MLLGRHSWLITIPSWCSSGRPLSPSSTPCLSYAAAVMWFLVSFQVVMRLFVLFMASSFSDGEMTGYVCLGASIAGARIPWPSDGRTCWY